ncbi:MAG: 3-oxoacyl-[acyl-carrier protein] reductase [Candidatus Poriferisodalaceae bacterium]|jgi:3-oxoacyl-[acyl-carrier protein] reductase|nr:SDR family oxidoreductase [Acidimicrobiales bacterium]|tara:strand:- start:4355 stop:5101 length:747 start_codon:yes stop_codon:yes gene_type:complete
MDLGINGRTAAVAAGSAGLGLGAAKALAKEGVRVAICGRDKTRLAEAASQIDGDVITIVSDMSDPQNASSFIQAATEQLGVIDILVTNAGGPPPGTFASTEIDNYQQAFDMNCKAMIELCRAAIPSMRERGWGRVCAITSVGVKQPIDFLIASSVARAGLTSFLKITAREIAADGVTVNSAQPGTHWTDRVAKIVPDRESAAKNIPARITGSSDDFGAAVAFLCSEQAKFITGTGLLVDGGQASGLLD